MVNAFATHRMGSWLRWRCSLAQCHFLCRYDRLFCFAGTNQSGIPQWRTWEKFPSAHPTGAECPKRGGLRKGDGGPHSSAADLYDHGTLGYAWFGGGSYHHGLLEIWGSNTLLIPWKHDQATYQLRYVFGYAMDGADLPCYILWPIRTEDNSFWCLDAWKGDWVQLDKCGFIAPVGIEQFFDAFCFDPKRPWRTAACQALGIPAGHIAEDTHINHSEGSKFTLIPRRIPVERWTIAEKSGADVVMNDGEESGSGADSGWSGVPDNPPTDPEGTISEASSVASDQDRFDAAYEAFRGLSEDLYDIDTRQYARGVTSDDAPGIMLRDGQAKLRELVHLPRNWPLARLVIPLGGLSKQVDRLLEGYCFQILATNRDPDAHNGKVIQTATHLTLILAEYLADTIAWLMRSILDHESKILFDTDTEPLLTAGFWILPLYRELLNSASRNRPSAASERARGSTGLVKIICKENKEQRGKRKYHDGAPHPKDRGGFTQWFGSCSLINTRMCGFRQAGRQWLQSSCLRCRLKQGISLTILSMGSLPEGFPKIPPGGMPGTNPRAMLLVQVEQRQRRKAMT